MGFSQNELNMQDGSWTECDFILYDSGGFDGNYGNNENLTLTLCPPVDGGTVTLDFLNFSTQINLDILSVYDGDSVNSPLIGAFSGVNTPGGVIIADNASGCLTLNFVSDGSGNTNGWAASVGCLSNFAINQPSDYVVCDEFGNGFGIFDFSTKDAEILGGLNPSAYSISYHETFQDAQDNVNALVNPYTSIVNPQTICARVEELPTGNVEVTCFNLIVQPAPIPNIQSVYEACPGNLISIDSGFNSQEFAFTWFYDGIILPNENGPSLITSEVGSYVLEVNSIFTGCFSQTEFEVVEVSFVDITNPTTYVVCDTDDDGISVFDLSTRTDEILGGNQNPSLLVTYHTTLGDAEGFFNILDPIFTNTIPFAQTLFARVSTNTGDCFATTTLDLIVDPDCITASSVEAFVCGDDPNIPVNYDLTSQEPIMLNGQNPSDFTIAYYLTEADAQNETNPLPNPEVFSVSGNSSVIYVRIENQSGSSIVVQIFLNYFLNPQIDFNGPYTICNGNEIVLFPFLNNPNGNYDFLWSTGETSPEIVVNIGGTYTVTVTDLISGCMSSADVEVIEGGTAPTLADAADLYSCEPNATFDLTSTLPEVLNGLDANQFNINFFNNLNSANTNTNSITDPINYSPLNSNETIFVRVQNVGDECFALSDFNITNDNSCPVVVDCQQPINNTFCYDNNQSDAYQYESSDDAQLQVYFIAGQVEVNFDELIVLDSDGVTNLNPITIYGNNGDLAGLTFISTGNSISISVNADGSVSCVNQNYTPISYEVSCADPNAVPGCIGGLTQPLDGATAVDENTNFTWTASSGIVTGYKISLGITPGGTEVLDNEDVGNVLTYDVDTLEYETTYYVTITAYNNNGDADGCEENSFTTRANPNQIVICDDGIVNTVYCYDNNDDTEFNFQSSDGLPLTIYFNAGGTEVNFDPVFIVDSDGTILNPSLEYGNGGDFAGLTYTSTGDSLTVRFNTDGSVSCGNGSGCCSEQFDFDVFCTSSVGIIDVNAFVDDNLNSVFDANEFNFSNGYFTYEVNGDGMINTVNSSTGHFQIISTNDTDVYEVTFNLYAESAGCYDVTIPVFNGISVTEGNTVSVDFPVIEEQSCEDLAVYIINYWTPPRPGFSHDNYLVLENLGFTTISSGTVEYMVDPQLIYNGVTSVNPNYVITDTANGFTVDFVNLQPGDVEYIDISLTCPVTVQLGEIVTNTATYLTDTNDLVPGNNFSTLSELVVGSWDPNDKMEAHGPRVLFAEFSNSDEWLYYTVRFQNLGTFPATFVRIEDEMDNQLDETTFQMLRSSHDYVVTRTDSSLEWFFEDINLPAEQDDAEGSNGFVYFRIKPKAGYALGDVIPNTAAIYFDFNAPVITNRFETEFVDDALSVSEFEINGFEMYPNPANDILNVKLNNRTTANLSIYDIQGKLMLEHFITEEHRFELNVSDLQSGLYFVKLNTASQEIVKKLIIE